MLDLEDRIQKEKASNTTNQTAQAGIEKASNTRNPKASSIRKVVYSIGSKHPILDASDRPYNSMLGFPMIEGPIGLGHSILN